MKMMKNVEERECFEGRKNGFRRFFLWFSPNGKEDFFKLNACNGRLGNLKFLNYFSGRSLGGDWNVWERVTLITSSFNR